MKKFLAAIATVMLIQQASAQTSTQTNEQTVNNEKIPASVQTAFYTQFPPASLQKWLVRKEGFIAVFKKDDKKQYAYYTHDGKWVATETRVKRTRHLPPAVREAWLNSGYAAWYVYNIHKVETPEGRWYRMHLNDGSLLDANHVDAHNRDHFLVLPAAASVN